MDDAPAPHEPLLQLQLTHGNRFVSRLLARADNGPAELSPEVEEEIERARGGGSSLGPEVRAKMESALGGDLSGVRVHTGGRADSLSGGLGARAFTTGRDVFFRAGAYQPETDAGRELLAHELVHVLQQRDEPVQAKLELGPVDDEYEREADDVAREVVQRWHDAPAATVRRACADCDDAAPCAECGGHESPVRRQAQERGRAPPEGETCVPPAGYTNARCGGYAANSWWLPFAYVNNATCACRETPNDPTAMCVRKFLQDRLAATPATTKTMAAAAKASARTNPAQEPAYQAFVQTVLTPIIYRDHVDAYASCCCSSGPAAYASWIGVTTVPLPCPLVGAAIRQFGSCHGTPGAW